MTEESALAQFLRARRSLVQPSDVGLPSGGRRRVAGLRREEVALLANISTDYYLRLEQGREEHPSDQVLTALSRALKLDDDAAAYLRNLTRHRTVAAVEALRDLHPGIQGLIDGWSLTAAHVVDPGINTVAANKLANALSPQFSVGTNIMERLFCDPASTSFYRNWKKLTAWAVALIRVLYGQRPDPALIGLVDDLIEQSARFRQLWDRHDVKYEPAGLMLVNHPWVGELTLNYQQLTLPATGHVLAAYWAEPGSPSEDAMRRLDAGRA